MSEETTPPSDFFEVAERLMVLIKQCESQASYLRRGTHSREGALLFTKVQEARLWLKELVDRTPRVAPPNE